jgi:hypothetical protein
MAYPKISNLTSIYQADGFGFFGFGDGGFGGDQDLINPQWNTNSGSYGFDPIQKSAYVEATAIPSYIGAALYDLSQSFFFAHITPAPLGTGTIQTGIIIRFDRTNYASIVYGNNGQFSAYVSNNTVITTLPMPAYDPVNHAFWRFRNDGDLTNIFFDTSPDGATWTTQGFLGVSWDITQVTVSIFAGFTGEEATGNLAYISSVNQPVGGLALSAKARGGTSTIMGSYAITDPNALSGRVNAQAGLRAKFTATLGIPEGGLTDWAYGSIVGIDPAMGTRYTTGNAVSFTGGNPLTSSAWLREQNAFGIPMPYRDGSYFQPAAYVNMQYDISGLTDSTRVLATNFQVEETTGLNNRLPLDASIYLNGCDYSGGSGVSTVTRSTDIALNGQYSGKIVSNNSPGTIGDGNTAYWVIPQRKAMVPIRKSPTGTPESIFGSVYLSTTRANTIWFASLVYYDINWNILSQSTHLKPTITGKMTHPGGGVWQQDTVFDNAVPSAAVYVGVVPVVQNPSNLVENVYASNHVITTASLGFTENPSTYSHPRTAQINVKANRVNYVLNSGFNTGSQNWFQGLSGISGSPNPASMTWDSNVGYHSVGSLRLDMATGGGVTGSPTAKLGLATQANFNGSSRQPVVQGLKIGHTYTITAWIKQSSGCPDVYMDFRDSNSLGITGLSTNSTKITNPERVDGTWTRLQTTYTVPPTGLSEYYFFFYVYLRDTNLAPFSFWVDSIMVEESIAPYGGYFDGGFASADYQWESGGTANNCRSYYYQDYNNKLLRLQKAMPSVLPVGEYYNLLFAQPIT